MEDVGLCDELSEDQIAYWATLRNDPQAACDRLVERAMEAGGRDNISVIVVRQDRKFVLFEAPILAKKKQNCAGELPPPSNMIVGGQAVADPGTHHTPLPRPTPWQ